MLFTEAEKEEIRKAEIRNRENSAYWVRSWCRAFGIAGAWMYLLRRKHVRYQAVRDLSDLALHMYGPFDLQERSRASHVLNYHPEMKLLDMAPHFLKFEFARIFHFRVQASGATETMNWLRLNDMLRLAKRLGLVDWKADIFNFKNPPKE